MSADGKWNVTINSPMGAQQGELTVKTSGATFTGSFNGRMGSQEISGAVNGDRLTWQTSITQPMPLTLDFDVTFSGDSLSGSVKAGAFGSSPITGNRTA